MMKLEDLGEHEDAPPAIPAATLVIYRHDPAGGAAQVLMVVRSDAMRFAGGAAVFPGGRIDPADYDLAAAIGQEFEAVDGAARIAAIRETLEETGLALGIQQSVTGEEAAAARQFLLEQGALAPVLERHGWTLALDRMVPFAHWLPRHRHMKVFDTRFYLYDVGTGAVDITVDDTENRHMFWASPEEVLHRVDAGELEVIFPTRRNLERLAAYPTYAECRAHAEATPIVVVTPHVVEREGQPWLMIPEGAGYPITGEPVGQARRA
jgi:8-oxo-dGTP pyrophosphatase MutT (NUDIX family)